ncbi:MAG: DUF1080 domain-containing protein [Petrimonas sp.]|jgi:hypothetical protein|nr:DUF1080 domain-containing protein [Dysgonamonadaceae bacterium]MDD3908954.1 DUF1080 domain-containing protein [Proteiniphilum sp.]MEA4995051.1 DUF1080 domain-containing protein [Petrimonas sp.]MDD3308933.1 DUF1080 domain-containing protein [Dysgonamonadaceae bacterium]MDD4398097.1 DUF1080 domain-containing protein [Dysgonamonadaceae bacterium]
MKKTLLLSLIVISILAISCTPKETKTALFNGKDLSNWNLVVEGDSVPGDQVFMVEDSTILIKGLPFGYMYTKDKYSNFTLELDYSWVNEPSNSGIFLLIENPTNPFPKGIECQLHAGDAGDFVLLEGSEMAEYTLPDSLTERPKFPVIKKQQPSSEKPSGEWNKAKITVDNGVVTVYINDVLQNKGTSPTKEGYIGLQSEGNAVRFKNIELSVK